MPPRAGCGGKAESLTRLTARGPARHTVGMCSKSRCLFLLPSSGTLVFIYLFVLGLLCILASCSQMHRRSNACSTRPKKKRRRKNKGNLEDDGIPLTSRAHPASLLPQFSPSAAPEKWQWLSEPGPGRTPCSQHAQAIFWHKVKKDSPLLPGAFPPQY